MAQKEVSVQITQLSASVEAASSAGASVSQSTSSATVISAKSAGAQTIMAGPQGPAGPSGISGMQGISGMSGTGPIGPSGATGASGISGTQGEQGSQGDQGDQGIQGPSGATGVSGISGTQGIQGPSGATGISGISGMQGGQGIQGTQGDQGDQGDQGIQGPSGATGIIGATGSQGPIGPHITGISGSGTGVSFFVSGGGILGPINIQGPSGATGTSGISGLKGDSGPQGDVGSTGPTGPQGSQGDQGLVGGDTFNFYFSTDTIDTDPTNGYLKFGNSTYSSITEIYVDDMEKGGDSITDWVDALDDVYQSRIKVFSASDAEKWAVFKVVSDNTAKVGYTQINVNYIAHSDLFVVDEEVAMTFAPAAQGPKGDTGPTGPGGAQGDQGDQGVAGTSGIGITGISGSGTGVSFLLSGGGTLGPINIQGPSGLSGLSGISGMPGGLGSTGPQGAQGDKGDKGDQGDQGIQGIQGPSGATGATGAVGPHITGVSGSGTGVSFLVSGGGVIGPINIQGPSGLTGISGMPGGLGSAGPQGDQGIQGSQGIQGTQGDQGLVGGDSFDFYWTTDTVVSDPGNGYIKFDNSTYANVQKVLVDDLEKGGDSIIDWVNSLDHVTGSRIKIFDSATAEKWAVFRIGKDNTAGAGYTQLNVNYIAHSDSFTLNEAVTLTYAPAASGAPGDAGPAGPSGATGATGVAGEGTGDFGGYSFSFYYNCGYSEALWSEGPGTSGLKLVTPNNDIRDTSGIDISYTNYRGGDATYWLEDFGNYGDVANRGILKLFHRDKVNVEWAAFLITGQPASRDSWSNVGVTWKSSSSSSPPLFTHSGETVVSFVPAGPTGQAGAAGAAGVGGGGGGGAPATGHTGAFQFHGGSMNDVGVGSLSGSNVLFEGHDFNQSTTGFEYANAIGIGQEFQELALGNIAQYPNPVTPEYILDCGMSGTLDVRGEVWVSGNLVPHVSGGFNLGYNEPAGLGAETRGKWWGEIFADSGTFHGAAVNSLDVINHGARVSIGASPDYMYGSAGGSLYCPTGYFDKIGSWLDAQGQPPLNTTMHGVFLHQNCLHFSPELDGGADLGTPDLYWSSLYLNNNSLVMSGVGMTGAVHIGFDNDHNLRISAPKTGNEVTISGTPLTGYSPNTVADIRFSGTGLSEATTLRANSVGELTISTQGDAGGQTTISNAKITSPIFSGNSGVFRSGINLTNTDLGITYFDVHDDGNAVGDMTFCGQVNQCVEDLGEFGETGWVPDPYGIGMGGTGFSINMAGSNMKKFNLCSHARGLNLTNIKAGRSVTIQIFATDGCLTADDNYYRFLSGNNLNFVGIEPHTLKIGKMGLLTITAYGTGASSCVCHWAESDYTV